jgi:ABC-type proline/glycine betaine transport system substrate-binding protein
VLRVIVHTCNPSTQEVEAGGPQVLTSAWVTYQDHLLKKPVKGGEVKEVTEVINLIKAHYRYGNITMQVFCTINLC